MLNILDNKLLHELLEASKMDKRLVIASMLKAISNIIPSIMCSLWKINERFDSISVIARENYTPPDSFEIEFVHKLSDSLIGHIISEMYDNNRIYYEIKDVTTPPYCKYHKSPKRISKLKLKRLISIPIPNSDNLNNAPNKFDIVLNIYPRDNVDFGVKTAQIIRDHLSLTISRNILLQKESITSDIISIYEQRAGKDMPSVLYPIINTVLRNYMSYEGCSVFRWDPTKNWLSLAQTTGIMAQDGQRTPKSEIYYNNGEGITGRVAELKKICIVDLENITDKDFKVDHCHKWKETTIHQGKSFLSIPIMSPSRPHELVGVIRFTNRINNLSTVVDYFSNDDIEIVKHACNLIGLYMEYDQSELVRMSFARQMAHEMLTPAIAIRGDASQLLDYWKEDSFPKDKIDSYLRDIFDHSELQIALTRTIQLLWNGHTTSDPSIYQLMFHDLQSIISLSKKIVIPVARKEKVRFDNIEIIGTFPRLFIDKHAFQQVFFNLLTNAIKYRITSEPESFRVIIEGHKLDNYNVPTYDYSQNDEKIFSYKPSNGYLVTVSDFGIGIAEKETSKIFLLGYRAIGQEVTTVRGLGIGLTVAKKVVEHFHSSIWVSSHKNPTTLSIFIPYKLANDDWMK